MCWLRSVEEITVGRRIVATLSASRSTTAVNQINSHDDVGSTRYLTDDEPSADDSDWPVHSLMLSLDVSRGLLLFLVVWLFYQHNIYYFKWHGLLNWTVIDPRCIAFLLI